MSKISKYYVLLLILFLFTCITINESIPGIKYPSETSHQITISQGIWGNVWFWEGDFEPPGRNGKITPVVREVHIYEGTPIDSVIRFQNKPTFFTEIKSPLVKVTTSNYTGFFEVELSPGSYSLFIMEDTLYYANGGDSKYIMPGYVSADSLTNIQIDITYTAAF